MRKNCFISRNNCHFKVHYKISAVYLLLHLILLPENRVYPIFNKLARYSLRWHHQLSKPFRLCWRIKKKTILPASPTAPHCARVIMRYLHFSHEQIQLMHKILHTGKKQMKTGKFFHTEKPQSWPAVTPDRWYSSVTQYPHRAVEPVTLTLPGHSYSTRCFRPALAETTSVPGRPSCRQEQALGSNPRAEQGWGCCWDLWHGSLSPAGICSASLSKTLKAAQNYNLGCGHSDI